MQISKKILAFSREAGGAAAIGPVCLEMVDRGWDLLLLGKDHSLSVFHEFGLSCIEFRDFSEEDLDVLVQEHFSGLPDCIFTSATSLPTLDMTERYLWNWGRDHKRPTIAVVDQWQNYAQRFSGEGHSEHLKYLPDVIFVMDELARNEMIDVGIPRQIIKVSGQPAFDRLKDECERLSFSVTQLRADCEIDRNQCIVTYVAESLKSSYGDQLGYDEQTTLLFLGDQIDELRKSSPEKRLLLLIKLHPENNIDEFSWVCEQWPELDIRIIQKELKPIEAIVISDLVVGMSSVMLIESIVAGKLTVSLQLDSKVDSQLVATRVGAIPFIVSEIQAKEVIRSLLSDQNACNAYLERQKTWHVADNATFKCMDYLSGIVGSMNVD